MTPFNKLSTFPNEHNPDNEETLLKQPHQDAFTPIQETLERIKRLHIKCGVLDTEHSFVIPINWLSYHKVTDVNVYIARNFYNAYYTPK